MSEPLTNKMNTLTPACVHSSTASLTPGRQGSCITKFVKYTVFLEKDEYTFTLESMHNNQSH